MPFNVGVGIYDASWTSVFGALVIRVIYYFCLS